jgi:hypothetical protein
MATLDGHRVDIDVTRDASHSHIVIVVFDDAQDGPTYQRAEFITDDAELGSALHTGFDIARSLIAAQHRTHMPHTPHSGH